MQKPTIPKGTRDFGPLEMQRRKHIFNTIEKIFVRYGFQPIETPAMENLTTLTGKYGDEGDQLIFKVLNSGDFVSKANLNSGVLTSRELLPQISEKALRYDLTVPFARFVVQHQNELTFPFRRYQIQPVWRADRPQRGRYREFFQCDADIIGSNSLNNEMELIQLTKEVFTALGIKVNIVLNDRNILAGIAELIGAGGRETEITMALDKLDKNGEEKVFEELKSKGFSDDTLARLKPFLNTSKEKDVLSFLGKTLEFNQTGALGVNNLKSIMQKLADSGTSTEGVIIDPSLARGLNYYTGAIFEVRPTEMEMGSLCGGGRYDNLTGIFGLDDVSGVGISFGADRIYDVMLEKELFKVGVSETTKVLLANFGGKEELYCLKLLHDLRVKGIKALLYPDAVKIKKQLSYADSMGIKFVVLIGSEEMKSGLITMKDLVSGEQESLTWGEMLKKLNANT